MKLQSVLLPDDNICNEEALYYHRDGSWVSFDGYFNLFYLEKHHKYCDIEKLTLELLVLGVSSVAIMHDKEEILKICLDKNEQTGKNPRSGDDNSSGENKDGATVENESGNDYKITENDNGYRISVTLPYEKYDRGVLYFKVRLSDKTNWAVNGHYRAKAGSFHPTRLAVNICTFKREPYVLRNMRSLMAFLDKKDIDGETLEVSRNMNVFIVDNGQTLLQNKEFTDLISKTKLIKVIPNANTGGTGGFSRGMQEAMDRRKELSLTHLLMMDDDAVFDPDLFIRLYGFLTMLRDEYKEITVGGALMREDYQYIQHAMGEWFSNFKVINKHPLTDMRSFDTCTQYWLMDTEDEHDLYGAWWCCCYHMNAVTKENMPLPIFVHHDDIQFGLRQAERGIVFLNGVSVWHQGFETVFPGVKQYYNMRNTLITMQMYEPEILKKRILSWSLRRYIGMLINYRYADCEFIYRGLLDFLKGKEWLMASDPEAIHKELMATYKKICPMRELTDEEKELVAQRDLKLTPDRLREYYNSKRFQGTRFKKYTFNGWILPGRKSLKVITPLDTPWEVYRQKQILLYEPGSGKGCVMRKDNKELFKAIGRMMRMAAAISRWNR